MQRLRTAVGRACQVPAPRLGPGRSVRGGDVVPVLLRSRSPGVRRSTGRASGRGQLRPAASLRPPNSAPGRSCWNASRRVPGRWLSLSTPTPLLSRSAYCRPPRNRDRLPPWPALRGVKTNAPHRHMPRARPRPGRAHRRDHRARRPTGDTRLGSVAAQSVPTAFSGWYRRVGPRRPKGSTRPRDGPGNVGGARRQGHRVCASGRGGAPAVPRPPTVRTTGARATARPHRPGR